ncbi:ABC transporter permease [Frankia sp. Cas3]|uniref:ABC transporter permease n=1 Tax=Frankia sp. Cas3 TaxID=3073926 RepID=UPI002AD52873|nr:ABC transporter permease [Frankia sp. Cas3]
MTTLRRAARLRSTKIALVILGLVAVLAVAGGALAPHDPLAQDTSAVLRGPSGGHWFGTDYLGRDVLSRLMDATGRSVVGALEAVVVGFVLGVPTGLASVVCGRIFEWAVQRTADTLMTLPYIIFAIAVTGIIGNGSHQAMLAIGVLFSPLFFRITRAVTLGLTAAQYVEVAELLGASRGWIIRTHIWNKVLPTIAVTTANAAASALLAVQSLSFLGIGVQPPAPTWGGMLSSDLGFLAQQPWSPAIPAAAIMITVASLNAIADAIRDTAGVPVDDEAAGGTIPATATATATATAVPAREETYA